jgi:hypothetical protein
MFLTFMRYVLKLSWGPRFDYGLPLFYILLDFFHLSIFSSITWLFFSCRSRRIYSNVAEFWAGLRRM